MEAFGASAGLMGVMRLTGSGGLRTGLPLTVQPRQVLGDPIGGREDLEGADDVEALGAGEPEDRDSASSSPRSTGS